jgi:hypothetical protein
MSVSLECVPRKCFLCGLFPGHITRTPADSELVKSPEKSQSEKGGSAPWLGGHGQSSLSRQFGDCEVGLQEVLGPGKWLSRISGQLWDWESPGRLSCCWESPGRLSCCWESPERLSCSESQRVYTVIPSCKCVINPITNPNPVYSHLTRDNIHTTFREN